MRNICSIEEVENFVIVCRTLGCQVNCVPSSYLGLSFGSIVHQLYRIPLWSCLKKVGLLEGTITENKFTSASYTTLPYILLQ